MSIIVRGEEKSIMIFNTNTSDTAIFTGKELEVLKNWFVTGKSTPFIKRLKLFNLVDERNFDYWLNEIEKSTNIKAPLRSFNAPESVHIELTSRCNLGCPQCYKNATSEVDLSFERLMELLKQCSEMKVFQIAFGGGEPLLYTHLLKAVETCTTLNMACTITTSGVGLDETLLNKLIKAGVKHIQVSLNGSTANIHNKSRAGFEIALEGLALLSKTKISYGINWVARKDNIDDFNNIIYLAKSFNIHNINVLRYKPSQTENYEEFALSKDETQQLQIKIANCSNIKIKLDSAYSNLLCSLNDKSGYLSGCGAGRRFIAVDCYGYFKPCSHINISEYDKDLKHYWHHSKSLNLFRTVEENVTEPCKSCKYLSGCRGCRAICKEQFGHILAGDLSCKLSHA